MPKIVIATVAEKGGGKGLFAETIKKLLPDKRVVMIRSSDIWRQIVRILGKEESQDNIEKIATALRQAFNDDGILNTPLERELTQSEADIIILDGLRKPQEVKLVKNIGGIVVYIVAKPEIRFRRRKKRGETVGETEMDFEQFLDEDKRTTNYLIRHVGETLADVTIENSGTVKEFKEKIKTFLEERVIPKLA